MGAKFIYRRIIWGTVILSGALGLAACGSAGSNTTTTSNGVNSSPGASASPSASASAPDKHGGASEAGHDSAMKMESSPGAESAPYDLQFIDTMSGHHKSAVEMAMMAETKASREELKAFAAKMVTDQQKEIGQMKEWRDRWYAGKPEAVNMEMPGMKDTMQGMDMQKMGTAKGSDFDLMFIEMMVPHHQSAVVMAREALEKGEHPEIKRLAQEIIKAQETEIAQLNRWKAAWGGARTNAATSH